MNFADEIYERILTGAAHDDAYLLITIARTKPLDDQLLQAEADVLNDHARASAAAVYLASLAASYVRDFGGGLGYDVDALLAGLALNRPPFG